MIGHGLKRLKQEVEALCVAMGDDPNVLVTTHKALARTVKDDRARHRGMRKGHNDWKDKRGFDPLGLAAHKRPCQIIGYKTHRAAWPHAASTCLTGW